MESVFHNKLTCHRCGTKGLVGVCNHWEWAIENHKATCNFETDCYRCGWSGWKEVRVKPAARGIMRTKKRKK